ncbi:Histone-lysine N-methyltransferase 2D [Merluccius polli]|uniref:Histone-lysine N-methyltransferase 2D n=1 Tax=Merluccius polli TaxID=89951 RepID=A0AA47N5B0_MERPO|nr:Histone-lysine N-methyltransferase 2D [Merluccius polli]
MEEQKSNCEENDSEPTADDGAPAQQPLKPGEESDQPPLEEDMSGAEPAMSSTSLESSRACALCNCVERSLHGQRELRHFRPSSERPTLEPTPSSLPRPGNDDLSSIGFSDSSCLAALFDDSGGCWVHHWCAVWSEGVKRLENDQLDNVDTVVISGTKRHCEYCKRLGATIRCHAEGCSRFYHFPCSAASGSFLSMKKLALLCSEHIDKAEELGKKRLMNLSGCPNTLLHPHSGAYSDLCVTAGQEAWCAVCDSAGDLVDLLFCTGCGQHYHAACLEIGATPIQRSGWQCPECKVCQTCRQPGEDTKMLVCDACDKGYHTFCLQPAMDSLPSDPWKCRRCRVCSVCGVGGLTLAGSSNWFHHYTVCEGCQQQRSSTCAVCSKAALPPVTFQSCSTCHRLVHSECASLAAECTEDQYTCLLCKEAPPPIDPAETQVEEASKETDNKAVMEVTTEDEAAVATAENTTTSDEPPMELGAAAVETVEVEENSGKVEVISEQPSVPTTEECGRTEQEATCAPTVEEVQAESQLSPASSHQAETQSTESPVKQTPDSKQGPGEMQEVDTTAEHKTNSTAAQPSNQAPPTSTPEEQEEEESEPMAVDQADQQDPAPCLGSSSPSSTSPLWLPPPSASADTQGCPSADEADSRALPQSEEDEDEDEEEEEDEEDGSGEQMKSLQVRMKEERQVKEELLDEASNLSHGDGSSSGFLGSPAEPDPQDFCLLPSRRSRA